MNPANEALREALAIAPRDPGRALELLEQALTTSRLLNDRSAISSLARTAGLISIHTGGLRRGLSFYKEALAATPEDPHLHFACGDAHRSLGERSEAAAAFARSAELATEQGDADMIRMASDARSALERDSS